MPYDLGRSDLPEVRNPILALEEFKAIQALPAEQRELFAKLWYAVSKVSRTNADRSWAKNKGPMALYWKWSGAWAWHIARALRRGLA